MLLCLVTRGRHIIHHYSSVYLNPHLAFLASPAPLSNLLCNLAGRRAGHRAHVGQVVARCSSRVLTPSRVWCSNPLTW